ncbi:MAG: hypothetical protein ACR2KN_03745, partial [Geodermatophilaceae bacterium]
MTAALALLVLLPVGSGVLLALAGLGGRAGAVQDAAGPLAVAVSVVVLALAVTVAVGRPALGVPLLPGADA